MRIKPPIPSQKSAVPPTTPSTAQNRKFIITATT